jgi:ATP-dependent RNA helicase SUPV3L1/SUV3
MLDERTQDGVRRRLERWLEAWIGRRLAALRALAQAAAGDGLGGAGRGIAYRLSEQLGSMARDEAETLLDGLGEDDRRRLTRLGVRFGQLYLYVPDLLKPAANEARARLLRVFDGRAVAVPPPGRSVLRPAPAERCEDSLAVGYAAFADFAIRVDILERLAAQLRALARLASPFVVPGTLAAEAGLTRSELAVLVEALGFRPVPEAGESAYARPQRPVRRPRRDPSVHDKQRRAVAGPTGGSPFAVLARLKVAP